MVRYHCPLHRAYFNVVTPKRMETYTIPLECEQRVAGKVMASPPRQDELAYTLKVANHILQI